MGNEEEFWRSVDFCGSRAGLYRPVPASGSAGSTGVLAGAALRLHRRRLRDFRPRVGDMANRWALRKHPELERQMQIEKDDERNVAISNRAKAKAYDGMLFVLAALMVSFALMGADMAVVLLLVFAYLFIVGEFIYYLNKYQKEM